MNRTSREQEYKDTSLRELIESYLRYWYLFIIGVVLALTAAFIYLRYSTALYQSSATIIVKEEKSASGMELSAFTDVGRLFSRYNSNQIENELAILRSKRIISEAIKALNLNIRYETVGTIKATEIYERRPFEVKYLSFTDSANGLHTPRLYIRIKSETDYDLNLDGSGYTTYSFGNKVSLDFGDITVLPVIEDMEVFRNNIGKIISVTHMPLKQVAVNYQKRLNVINEINNSNVVIISMLTPVPSRAEDFINELIDQYNLDATNDNSQVARNTSEFIDDRLEIITRELDSVERSKEVFKSQNRLTNIESEAQLVLTATSEFSQRQLEADTKLELVNSMIEYMERSSEDDLLPANIGLEGEEIAGAVNNYNELLLQRNRLLKSSTPRNPVVENITNQLLQIRQGIIGGLENTRNGLEVSLRDLNQEQSVLNSKISEVPTQEKIYRGIERQQNIKEQLYLYLLQQREEASISLAMTSSKAKLVDGADSSNNPVSPQRPLIYLAGLLAGLIIPFVGIYLSNALNVKVSNRKDLERLLPGIPIVGEIPRLKKSDIDYITHNDRSVLAESFRILRTNLQYLFVNKIQKNKKSHTIFVTSTIKGEGKTFIAYNFALSLAITGKKTVLVGGDIRNPQLHRYLPGGSKDGKGLTDYITDKALSVRDISMSSEQHADMDIVLSGAIPPNPAEVLMEERTSEFFEELSDNYEYVIVDTAPSMLVTDTILINKYADILLYTARAGFTDKRLLEFPADAHEDGRLINMALILNSVAMSNFGYGNKYGYAYSDEKLPFFKRVFRRRF